jgi:23S rRNA (adenine2030-N6)-methyltransferase
LFSYRHAFHAGNHADVLKHAIFVQMLDYFNRKEAPYWVIDTHAGAGLYDLRGDWAATKAEYTEGLDRVVAAANPPPMIERYLEEVQHFNPDGVANFYPGSPWLALRAMRDRDRLRLFELHPSEADVLAGNLVHQGRLALRQTMIYRQDGFAGLKALLPPPSRRGIVIMDPSYEDKLDYRKSLKALNDGLSRFATGSFALWYPIVQRREVTELARSLERLKMPWVHATLSVRKPAQDGLGLHGSAMFVVNPPWTLHQELTASLPWLAKTLGMDNRAGYTLKQHGN